MSEFRLEDKVPHYVNNARIKDTGENVFIDFGFADPFDKRTDSDDYESTVQCRIVMNKSTFATFVKHLGSVEVEPKEESVPPIILSRCPHKQK